MAVVPGRSSCSSPGITMSDGSPYDAETVKRNWERAKDITKTLEDQQEKRARTRTFSWNR